MTIAGFACAAWIALAHAHSPDSSPASPPSPSPSADPPPAVVPHADADPNPDPAGAALRPPLAPTPAVPGPIAPIRAITEPEAVREKTLRVTGAILLGVPLLGEALWWRNEETERFHSVRENWFGRETYAGGADKVSHVVGGYIVARELSLGFEKIGNSPARSRALATGVTALAGTLVEAGDGFSVYGFAWEDVFADLVGAGLAAGVGAARLDDTVGIRFGYVQTEIPPKCCRATAYGSDYSRELYSFDLKLDGALRRLGARPGLARFLLVSLTYGSKGYRFSPPDVRQRNVGLDFGINAVEILKAIGVRENTWWGLPLLKFFTYYRLEYASWGWRYDFNHGKWSGFGSGGRFDPGRVIYQ
jgi:hypothetical protein